MVWTLQPQSKVSSPIMVQTVTLTAVNLAAVADINSRLDTLAYALKDADQKKVADARSYTRTFTNTFDDNLPSPYLDLGHFASMITKKIGDEKARRQPVTCVQLSKKR